MSEGYTNYQVFQHEIVEVVQTIRVDEPDPSRYEGKLVYMTGMMTTDQTLADKVLGVIVTNTLQLGRLVEVYSVIDAYRQNCITENKQVYQNGESYRGAGHWVTKKVEVCKPYPDNAVKWHYDDFILKTANGNSITLESEWFTANRFCVGSFIVMNESFPSYLHLELPDRVDIPAIPPTLKTPNLTLENGVIYGKNEVDNDVRITFKKLSALPMGFLGQVKNKELQPYITPSGQPVYSFRIVRNISRDELVADYGRNTIRREQVLDPLYFMLNLGLMGLFCLGLGLSLSGLQQLASIKSEGIWALAFSVTLVLAMVILVICWGRLFPYQILIWGLMSLIPLSQVVWWWDRLKIQP